MAAAGNLPGPRERPVHLSPSVVMMSILIEDEPGLAPIHAADPQGRCLTARQR